MKKFTMDDVLKEAYKVKLFSGKELYVEGGVNLVEYESRFVNGRLKKSNNIIWTIADEEELEEVYRQIRLVFAIDNSKIAKRKTNIDPLQKISNSQTFEPQVELDQKFFIKTREMKVNKLTEGQKLKIKKELEIEGIKKCEFIDLKNATLIRTTTKGYKVILYLQCI